MTTSGVDGCDVQTTTIKKEPLSDESEGDDTYSTSDINEGSDSEEETGQCVEYVKYNMHIDVLMLMYLSTAIGLAPGGSTHLHAIHRTSQLTTRHHE
jgi:hypothetical protein